MSSNMGRFMSPDYSESGDDPDPVPNADFTNPQSLNLYSYVQNNPLTNTDPDGHDCVDTTNAANGTVAVTAGSDCQNSLGPNSFYVNGTVTGPVTLNSQGDLGYSYTNYADGGGSSGSGVYTQAPPYGPFDGPANQAAESMIGNGGMAAIGYFAGGSAIGGLTGGLGLAELGTGVGLTTLDDLSALRPTPGQIAQAQKVLAENGPGAVKKAIRSFEKRLAAHEGKVGTLRGDPGSVQREITNFKTLIQAYKSVLGDQ